MVEPHYGYITSSYEQPSDATARMSRIFLMSNNKSAPHIRLRGLLDERWKGSDATFASKIPMTPSHFSKLVNGHTPLRTSRKLDRIAELLGTTTDFIITEVGRDGEDAASAHGGTEPDPGPWADSLIGYVEVSIRLQEVAETGAPNLSELVTGAYGAAIINGWPSEEFAKLDQWRDRLLREYKFQVVSRGEHERGWRSRDVHVGLRTAIAMREIEMTWDHDDLEDAKGVFTQEWITEFREKLRKEDEADPEGVRARRTEARRQFAALRIAEARYLGDPPTPPPEGTPVVGATQGSTTLEDATQLSEGDDAILEDRKKRPVRKRARGDPRSRA